MIMSSDSGESGQIIESVLSDREMEFMNSIAIPILDATQDERSLEDLSETFWNLCQWEKERADILDTKASYLLGLSTIAAAVVAVGGIAQTAIDAKLLWAGAISLTFFTLTVIASLYALLGQKYGGFVDRDVFSSLHAHIKPVGRIKAFRDKDPRRCFIRETILQRWLIYRGYSDANDSKFRRLVVAQVLAILSVLSLFGYLAFLLL
jgi:hypothetical protein